MFDPFTLLVTLLPLGCYLASIGAMNSLRTPIVVSGSRDFFALALGCIGLFLLGPASLFFPQSAFNLIGGWIWLVMVILYLLIVTMVTLALRPRLIIYSVDSADFVQRFRTLLQELDTATLWAGKSFSCPQLSIEGFLEWRDRERLVQIVSSHHRQDLVSWMKLHGALKTDLSNSKASHRRYSPWLIAGVVLLLFALSTVILQPTETMAAMKQVLRF